MSDGLTKYYHPNGALGLLPTWGTSTTPPNRTQVNPAAGNLNLPNPYQLFTPAPQGNSYQFFPASTGNEVTPRTPPTVQPTVLSTPQYSSGSQSLAQPAVSRYTGGLQPMSGATQMFQGYTPPENFFNLDGLSQTAQGALDTAGAAQGAINTVNQTAPQSMWSSVGNFFKSPIESIQGWMNEPGANKYLMKDGNVVTDKDGKPMIDPDFITKGDVWSGVGAGVQTALGAYGMFSDIGYKKDLIDNQRSELQLARDQFNEQLRHRSAVRNQNRGA